MHPIAPRLQPLSLAALLAALLLGSPAAHAQNVVFPADAGVVDVTQPPYSAPNDGVTDATFALQSALSAFPGINKIIYLPNGTYLLTNTLFWPTSSSGFTQKKTILQGQSTTGAVLRLADNLPAFATTNKAMIFAGTAPAQRFRNGVRSLTFHVGRGNPGAVGAQFIANNQGIFRDVNIVSGDGQGSIGLDFSYMDEIGPLLVKNVFVSGFRDGIRSGFTVNSMTFEDIRLSGQTRFGFVNGPQVVNIRGLRSTNSVVAVTNGGGGTLTLVDTTLVGTGAAASRPAVANTGGAFLARNLVTSGYNLAIANTGGTAGNAAGPNVAEFTSRTNFSVFPSPTNSLNLPVLETPTVPWDDLTNWVSPTAFGAIAGDGLDDTAAIQAAFDAGKPTVYFPNGAYLILGDVFVRGAVRRVVGCEASITGPGKISLEDGPEPVVVIERFDGLGNRVVHNTSRAVVFSSITMGGGNVGYRNTRAGDVFFEDVVGGPFVFTRQRVWARQLNAEDPTTKILNDGGLFWVLGYKTERDGTLLETRAGGRSEVLGSFAYATSPGESAPMWVNHESALSFTMAQVSYDGSGFTNLVTETRDGVTNVLPKSAVPNHINGNGSAFPLYTGYLAAPPTVTLTAPDANSVTNGGQTMIFTAAAAPVIGALARVEFYVDLDPVGVDTNAPFEFAWPAVTNAGPHLARARAVDDRGAVTWSEPVRFTITNLAPAVALLAPTNNAVLVPGNTVTLAAAPADADGTITRVEFFADATKLGETVSTPWSFNWSNAPAGLWALTAVATDNGGATGTSAVVNISVRAALQTNVISTATGQGADAQVAFSGATNNLGGGGLQCKNDSATTPGHAKTWVRFDFAGVPTNATLYDAALTLQFNAPRAAGTLNVFGLVNGDPGELWLEGTNTGTVALGGEITWNNAPGNSGGGGGFYVEETNEGGAVDNARVVFLGRITLTAATSTITVTRTNLPGLLAFLKSKTNRLATLIFTRVESSNAQQHFFSSKEGSPANAPRLTLVWEPFNARPTCSLTNPPAGAVFTPPATLALGAVATDADGAIARVEFFSGTNLVGSDSNAPYALTLASQPVGRYTLTARAADNLGLVGESAPVELLVASAAGISSVFQSNGVVGLVITGESNFPYRLEASTNLTDWLALVTNAASNGAVLFEDAASGAFSRRFYRATPQP